MPKSNEEYIEEFHKAFGVSVCEEPSIELLKLRKTLINEEVKEFFAEVDAAVAKLERGEKISKENYTKMLKEIADVQVVVSGTIVSIKQLSRFREAFIRVHESNMSKLGTDGKPIRRDDGKVLKGPNYKEPDLSDLV